MHVSIRNSRLLLAADDIRPTDESDLCEGSGAPANMPATGGESTKTVLYAALFALLVLLIAAALQARIHTTPPKI